MTGDDVSDGQTLAALRDMWRVADPVPADLEGRVLALIDAELIASDVAMLELVEEYARPTTVRGMGDERTLRFTYGANEVLIRIAPAEGGARIDGWAVPERDGTVRLRVGGRVRATAPVVAGRFAFTHVPGGDAAIWFEPSSQGSERPRESTAWRAGPFPI